MSKRQYETVIIGGGQAGLATAWHLTHKNMPCVILDENERVGASWRKRWDSLRLFTPGRHDNLPGMPYPGPPGSHPGKDDIADYLEAYASRFGFPIRNGVKVDNLYPEGDQFTIETQNEIITAENVVVATGPFHHPRIPDYADELNRQIIQFHSSEYRSPSQIQDGSVLVVGAGQSGAEIALDLARDHEVWLSGRDVGEEPAFQENLSSRIINSIMVFAATKVLNVANPLGRKLRKHFFYPSRGIPRAGGSKKRLLKAGVKWVGRTNGTSNGYPRLEDGKVLKINNVIWCTGFVTDYSWIKIPVFNEYGYPRHNRGVVHEQPGLYFIGMPFQRTLSSSLLLGVGKDAGFIAKHIASRQNEQEVRFSTKIAGEIVR
ncbi:flavin-containing monooxygenase [Maribellus mangrovi]|uniref:flavin-containing monooxygenase n=1 Tax=Maribellus mangrovi TaxID=3133146 RepID=UPI0030EC0DBF